MESETLGYNIILSYIDRNFYWKTIMFTEVLDITKLYTYLYNRVKLLINYLTEQKDITNFKPIGS